MAYTRGGGYVFLTRSGEREREVISWLLWGQRSVDNNEVISCTLVNLSTLRQRMLLDLELHFIVELANVNDD